MSDVKLYRPFVSRSEPLAWLDEGSPVTVNGTPMVQYGLCIVPAVGWSGTKAEALRAAADQLEARAMLCQAEATRLREEAASGVANH